MYDLRELGWDEGWSASFAAIAQPGLIAGRVVAADRRMYDVWTAEGEQRAEAAGRMMFRKASMAELPKTGDWVALTPAQGDGQAVIHHVLPRRTCLSRKAAGHVVSEQVLAANVDVLFVVQSLDSDFNLRRLDRYLAMAWEGGVRPVVVLNKADLCTDVASKVRAVAATAGAAAVIAISAASGEVEALRALLRKGLTFALLGSSGVGKSTIINTLAGEEIQATFAVSEKDGAGRHTTTRRQLLVMPGGALLIDTPGMRELALWSADDGLAETFADIEELAAQCHFSDCTHRREKRCAVRAAVAAGRISEDRYDSYMKLQDEAAMLDRYRASSEAELRDARSKAIARWSRGFKKLQQARDDE